MGCSEALAELLLSSASCYKFDLIPDHNKETLRLIPRKDLNNFVVPWSQAGHVESKLGLKDSFMTPNQFVRLLNTSRVDW